MMSVESVGVRTHGRRRARTATGRARPAAPARGDGPRANSCARARSNPRSSRAHSPHPSILHEDAPQAPQAHAHAHTLGQSRGTMNTIPPDIIVVFLREGHRREICVH